MANYQVMFRDKGSNATGLSGYYYEANSVQEAVAKWEEQVNRDGRYEAVEVRKQNAEVTRLI